VEAQPSPVPIALLIPLFLLSFVALWMFVNLLLSLVSGWTVLAARYRTEQPFAGQVWTFQSGQMRLVSIRNCLTIGASREGLYLAMMALFRFRHPPLFIPWSQIQITPKKNFFRKGMEFHLGGEQGVSLWIGANLAERLRQASI
jgi:hypothetical protein